MRKLLHSLMIGSAVLGLCVAFVCQTAVWAQTSGEKGAAAKDIDEKELAASVPELSDLHEVVYPLWHNAYPEKDYGLIKGLLPRADTLVAKLDAAVLPGILREKQQGWEGRKANLKKALLQLHNAADADNQEEMLKATEAFHAAYEQMVRTIRPIVPALELFHQELYKLYHYYAPAYDLAQIRSAGAAMKAKIPPLKEAQLPKRLADRQANFMAAVEQLEMAVNEFTETAKTDSKEKILAGVEKVHTAYQKAEKLFD